MMNQNISAFLNDSTSSSIGLSPQEEALRSLCKQVLKSKFFRGYYEERRFVDALQDYRDIIRLHRSEREFERLLLDVKSKLQLFYQQAPLTWIGITQDTCMGLTPNKNALDTHIWLELEGAAFGQYWFHVKSLRFRGNEILLKLKVARSADAEEPIQRMSFGAKITATTNPISAIPRFDNLQSASARLLSGATQLDDEKVNTTGIPADASMQADIGLQEFIKLIVGWGAGIKHSCYDFMSNDINRHNIKALLKFMGLALVMLFVASVEAIKFLGTFSLRFMCEFSRFTHAITPIIIKCLDMVQKIIGGIFLFLAMIWKDLFWRQKMNYQPLPPENFKRIEYNRPTY